MEHTKLTNLVPKERQRKPGWKARVGTPGRNLDLPVPAEGVSFTSTTSLRVKAAEPDDGDEEPGSPASPASARSTRDSKESVTITEPRPTEPEEDPQYQITKSLSSQFKSSDTVNKYVTNALAKGGQPLPILTRITAEGELFLLNYKLNAGNSESFTEAM